MSYGVCVRVCLEYGFPGPDGSDSLGMTVRSLKVLILEDHPFQLMALHQMLNANQVFDVLTADSVEAARLSLLSRGPVDIAICDLQMDGPDGLDLIRHLAQDKQANALIVLSSTDQCVLEGVAQLALSQGLEVLGCLQKPTCAAALHELIEVYERARQLPDEDLPGDSGSGLLSAEQLFIPSACTLSDMNRITPQWIAHFQPKVSLDGAVLGVEALARWQHPQYGLLSPGRFLETVAGEGLLAPLTWRILDQALQFSAQRMNSHGQALPVAVNIAPQLLQQADFSERVLQALADYQLPANVLTLEMLEQDAEEPKAWQMEGLLRLCMHGCRLSIDDFGMGASSIERLLQWPFSELKIPTEFVRGMAEDARKSAVVAGTMLMAKRLAMTVVVEGVETLDDFHSLLMLDAPAIQGYFVARPMSAADLSQWLDERRHIHPERLSPDVQERPCSCR